MEGRDGGAATATTASQKRGKKKNPLDSRLEPATNPFTLHEPPKRGGGRVRYDDDDTGTETGSKFSMSTKYRQQHYSSTTMGTQGSQGGGRRQREGIPLPMKVELGASDMPPAGMKYRVHGAVKAVSAREAAVKRMPPRSDTHLEYGRLSIFCYDRMTGEPVAGCAVCISTLDRWAGDGQLNSGSTFGRSTVSSERGHVQAKVLAGRAYVLSATCTGYYPFGRLGERLMVNVQDGKLSKIRMAMVPIKVGVIITAKEMMPAREAVKRRYETLAKLGEMAAQQGVTQELAAMMSEEHITLQDASEQSHADFVAFSLQQDGILEVRHRETGELVGRYGTDEDGKAFFYGPQTEGKRKSSPTKQALVKGTEDGASDKAEAGPFSEDKKETVEDVEAEVAAEAEGEENADDEEVIEAGGDKKPKQSTLTYLTPGWYNMSLHDPSRMIVFTGSRNRGEELDVDTDPRGYVEEIAFEVKDPGPIYRPSPNRYNISSSAQAIELIYTDNTSGKFIAKGPGAGMYVPIEIYTRVRPRMEILVFDVVTEEDVGSREAVPFEVEKIVRTFREVAEEDVDSQTALMPWGKSALQSVLPRQQSPKSRPGEVTTNKAGVRGWVDVSSVGIYSGSLNNTELKGCLSMKDLYGQPGERYIVTVRGVHPYVEWTQRAGAGLSWDDHAFRFYFQKKVTLIVGLRERYSQGPCVGRTVRAMVLEVPPPPVPPTPVRMPGEGPVHYARRIIEHVLDWCVESHEESTIEHVAREFDILTDEDGLVRLPVAPQSLVRVMTTADGDYEDEEMVEDVDVTDQAEQFVGFQLEKKCFLHTRMHDASTKEVLEGVRVQLSMVEDEDGNAIEPPRVILEDVTDANGEMETLDLRAGSRVAVKVLEAPFFHLAPRYAQGGSDTLVFRITGTHHAEMYLPRKPRIKMSVYDSTSGEEVMGLKFRVLVDRNLRRGNQEVAQKHGTPRSAEDEGDIDQMETWGEELYRCYSGSPDAHRLFIDTQCKVAVQVYPLWPYRAEPQMHVQFSGGVQGCPPFVFWLLRSPSAAAFWTARDAAVPELWDKAGCPMGPPWNPLARLQPIVSSARAIAPLRPELEVLRPGWHPARRVNPEDLFGFGANEGGGGLPHFLSDSDGRGAEEALRLAALEHVRMGDPGRLPIEERKLMQLLTLWGCFKHVKGTSCQCRATGSVAARVVRNPDPVRRRKFVGTNPLEMENGTGRLRLGDTYINSESYTAPDILANLAEQRRAGSPVKRLMLASAESMADAEARREAVYCDSPFFTLWLPNGQGIHVGVHDGLYRDLVLCMEKMKKSIDACDEQLAKIEAYNATRSIDGGYVFGSTTVAGAEGGVFLVDTSAAMPPHAISFVARQLSFMLETWAIHAMEMEGEEEVPKPMFNCVAAAGPNCAKLSDSVKPAKRGMIDILPPWFTQHEDTSQAGFNMVRALKMALRLADGRVPVYVITGAQSRDMVGYTAAEVFDVIEADTKGHIAAGESVMPIHGIEVHPLDPNIFFKRQDSVVDEELNEPAESVAASRAGVKPPASITTANMNDEVATNAGRAASRVGPVDDKPDAYNATSDIFMRLLLHISDRRVRLIDIFRQEDKDRDGALTASELGNLIRRVMPSLSPSQLRYLQLMLDNNGDDTISYKELVLTMRISKNSGVAMKAREGLELVDILRKIAFVQVRRNKTAKELFLHYDTSRTGFMDRPGVRRMLLSLFPSANRNELDDLAEAFWAVDVNQDGRISREEFCNAILRGGAEFVDFQAVWGTANYGGGSASKDGYDPNDPNAGGLTSNDLPDPVTADLGDGTAMRELMTKVCAVTAGRFTSFDMGAAKAAAEYVDSGAVAACKSKLEEEYEKMAVFEKQYGGRVLVEKRARENWRHERAKRVAAGVSADGNTPRSPARRSSPPARKANRRPRSAQPLTAGGSRPSRGLPSQPSPSTSAAAYIPESPSFERTVWEPPSREASGVDREQTRRPQTAPSRRAPSPFIRKTPSVSNRWEVHDGIASFTSPSKSHRRYEFYPETPSPQRESLIMSVTDLGGEAAEAAGLHSRGFPKRSPPSGGGFRDPRNRRPDPEDF